MPVTEGTAALPLDTNAVKQMGILGSDGFLYFPKRDGSGFLRVADSDLHALLDLVIDNVNSRIVAEINTLHRTEDSITAVGENVTPFSLVITTTTATQLVAAPAAGNHLVVKAIAYQLREDVDTVASIRDGSGGTDYWHADLAATSDALAPQLAGWKLSPDGWKLTTATGLFGKLSVAPATTGVRFVGYTVTRPD